MKSHSAAELAALRARGESCTDWARVKAKTEAEIEQDIAADPDSRDQPADWYKHAQAVMPGPKRLLSLPLDTDLVDWFRAEGPGYQTRINAVLLAFVTRQKKQTPQR